MEIEIVHIDCILLELYQLILLLVFFILAITVMYSKCYYPIYIY